MQKYENKKFVTQSNILYNETNFMLNYYILIGAGYRVAIEKREALTSEIKISCLPLEDYEEAIAFIYKLASGFVTPCSLDEIIEDEFAPCLRAMA